MGKSSKFKIGDDVVIIKASRSSYWYANKVGEKFTVLDDNTQFNSNPFHVKLEYSRWAEEDDLMLFSDYEKESTAKWLKENKWFIRTGTKEKSELVQKWLFEHGMEWLYGKTVQSGFNDTMLTNTDCVGETGEFILFSRALEKKNAKEIKIEFETVIKSVKLPEPTPKEPVLTEQQIKIAELEDTIAKVSAQIIQLKEMK